MRGLRSKGQEDDGRAAASFKKATVEDEDKK